MSEIQTNKQGKEIVKQSQQSTTGLWRSAVIISAVLFAVFTVFEIVICVLNGNTNNTTAGTQRLLFLGAVIFGALAMLMSLVMLVLSIVMYLKGKQRERLAQSGTDLTKLSK